MIRRGFLVAPFVLLLLITVTPFAHATWPGWPNGIPAFRAPAALIDATAGDLSDYQWILQVCSGDIDGNGLPDLAVLYRDSTAAGTAVNKVSFVMNHKEPGGPGLMSWPKAMPGYVPLGGAGPDGIQLGDMDTDGKADLITFNAAQHVIREQFSTGTQLKPPTDYTVNPNWQMEQIQVANRNEDFWQDLYVRYRDPIDSPGLPENVAVFKATYAVLQLFDGRDYPTGVSMKIAKDGYDWYPDIFINTGSTIQTTSSADGWTYGANQTLFDMGIDIYDFAVGDLNGDSKADLATLVWTSGPPAIYVCYGNAGGGFGSPTGPYYTQFTGRRLTIADMNANGFGEIYVSDDQWTPAGGIQVLEWPNPPTNAYDPFLNPGRLPGGGLFDNVDGDPNPDLIVALTGLQDHNIAIIQGGSAAGRGVEVHAGPNASDLGSPAVADFDRDGKPDLACPVGTSTRIVRGIGGENFVLGASLPAWANERDYAVDLNRDGKPDLVSSGDDFGYDAWRFQLGNGDGTFQAQQVFAAGAILPRHPFADFNRDGIQDFVYLNKIGMVVGVTLEDGAGGMSGGYGQPVGGLASRPEDVAISDLDRDGDLDLAVATQSGVQIVLNTGTGLVLGPIWDSGHDYKTIAAGDVDRDGKPDIVAQERIGAPYDRRTRGIQIFYGNGLAQVARRDSLGANERWGNLLEISDVNRDGRPDIVAAAYYDGFETGIPPTTAGVYLQSSTGGFGQRLDYAQGYVSTGGFALLADATGDGQPDIVSPNLGPSLGYQAIGSEAIFQVSPGNSPAGGWGTNGQTDYTGTTNPLGLAWGDMNRDGKPDLVGSDQSGSIFIYFGDGNGGLTTPPYSIPAPACDDVALADLNQDGRLDVLGAGENGFLVVLLGQGDGALLAPVAYNGNSGALRKLAVGDFNRDGKPDVAAIGFGWQVPVFFCGNNGGMYISQFLSLPGPGQSIDHADINRDGIQDLVILLNQNQPAVWTALGNASGTFASPSLAWSLQGEGWPYALAIADVNGDGTQDVAADFSTPDGEVIYLLNGNGTGGFGGNSSYPSVDEDWFIGFADLDGDPSPDLVMSGYGGTAVRLSNGRGGLGPLQYTGYASGPGGFAVADLDRDGMNDLVITDTPNGIVSVLINNKSAITGVAESGPRALRSTLAQNAPNPFNPRTSIAFTMAQAGPAKLAVYDVQGRQVAKLVDARLSAGPHRVEWDGRAESGEPAASGVYFYRLEAAGKAISRRMVLLK